MKTLLAFLFTFGAIAGAVSLDFHRLSLGVWLPILAVAALFAFALNDGGQKRRPLYATIARFPSVRPGSLGHRADVLNHAA